VPDVTLPNVPAPWRLVVVTGVASRFARDTAVTPLASLGAGAASHDGGVALVGQVSAGPPRRLSTGVDGEMVAALEAAAALELAGRGRVAPTAAVEGRLAHRSFTDEGDRFARILVPSTGLHLGVRAAVPAGLALELTGDASYDLWAVHAHEPPADTLTLPRFAGGASLTLVVGLSGPDRRATSDPSEGLRHEPPTAGSEDSDPPTERSGGHASPLLP
jgi:hypothetical protein